MMATGRTRSRRAPMSRGTADAIPRRRRSAAVLAAVEAEIAAMRDKIKHELRQLQAKTRDRKGAVIAD